MTRAITVTDTLGETYAIACRDLIPPVAATLCDISQVFADSDSLTAAVKRVVQALVRSDPLTLQSAAVMLNDGASQVQVVESAQRRGRLLKLATAATDAVIRSGQPIMLRHHGPDGVARTARDAGADLIHLATPIVVRGQVVGTLSADVPYSSDRDYGAPVGLLGVVASMIGQAIAQERRFTTYRDAIEGRLAATSERREFANIVGTSRQVVELRAQMAQVAATSTTVLLRGESGTGKGLIAQTLHDNSSRARRPFVTVSCAALPHTLIESELFGHEKGAFTGAVARKKGRFEMAEGGTLFLDEIGELDHLMQVKLLRVLQEREFERVGGETSIRCDVRIIAATNKNLEAAMAAQEFREDLYYRLNVFTIHVPPLRERQADLLLLSDYFLEQFAREHGRNIRRISTPAIDMLTSYHWPGNVRELANVIERAVVVCDSDVLHAHHLPPTLQTAESTGTVMNRSLQELVEAVERDALQDALKSARGDRATAARLLRTTRRIFNYKVEKYGIDWNRFRT